MPCATRAPVAPTAWKPAARNAAPQGLLASARAAWESKRALGPSALALGLGLLVLTLSLLALGPKHFSAFFTPHADETARTSVTQTASDDDSLGVDAERPRSSALTDATSLNASRVGAGRGAPPRWSVEFEKAEFDEEEEEEQLKGALTDASEEATPEFPPASSVKVCGAVSAFVARIGDFLKLPRAPPACA